MCQKKVIAVETDVVEAEIREYAQHFDFSFGDDEVEPSPLDYFNFFDEKFLRVELIAKHLLAIPATSVPKQLSKKSTKTS